MKRNKTSTRKLLNLNEFTGFSLRGWNKTDYLYYKLTPFNLSVMSDLSIKVEMLKLSNILKQLDKINIFCINGKENFEENKNYIYKKIEQEESPAIRKLLQADYDSFDDMLINTATNRIFLLSIPIHQNSVMELKPYIRRIEKTISEAGWSVNRLTKDEIKQILAIYLEDNVVSESFDDFDGERWYKDVE